jgi:hypothetical protein
VHSLATDKLSCEQPQSADVWRFRVGKTSSIAETFYHAGIGLGFAWRTMLSVKLVTVNCLLALCLMLIAGADSVCLAAVIVAAGAALAGFQIHGAMRRIKEVSIESE